MYSRMKEFFILDSQDNSFKAIVLSMCSESLSDNLGNVANLLSKKKIHGKILLDYYLSNDSQTRRFYEIAFNGNDFDLTSFKKAHVSSKTKESINSFYTDSASEIINSVCQ